MPRATYHIKGMHCASCELLLENEFSALPGVTYTEVSLSHGTVVFEYDGEKPGIDELNEKFKEQGYAFSEEAPSQETNKTGSGEIVAIALLIIIVFLALSRFGLSSFVSINSNSSLAAFLIFGLIAGVSSCAALIGGLVLSLSPKWSEEYGVKSMKPHLLFSGGRLLSFSLLGGLLGFVGERFVISPTFSSILVIVVSLIMLILALQMLGVETLNRFRLTLPKSLSRRNLIGKKAEKNTPFVIGFLTFLLPCGFTVVAEGAAILAGSPYKGLLIMLSFVLGTTLPLLLIGLSSTRLLSNQKLSNRFLKVAGVLIIFFAIYNLNFQFDFTRTLSENTATSASIPPAATDTKSDVQVIKTVFTTAADIVPNTFKVKSGKPVRFEVEVKENGFGCMSTIMIPGLWDKTLTLKKDKTLIMEFTPSKAGSYQITCAMGVPRGTLIVTD
jgi:sulfite exporter TauE/SafE/copper chaperone CopZ